MRSGIGFAAWLTGKRPVKQSSKRRVRVCECWEALSNTGHHRKEENYGNYHKFRCYAGEAQEKYDGAGEGSGHYYGESVHFEEQ